MITSLLSLTRSVVDLPSGALKAQCQERLLCLLCDITGTTPVPFGGPELDQPNCTLGHAPERNTEVKCELFLHCHTGVDLCWQVKSVKHWLLSKLEMLLWVLLNLNWDYLKNDLCREVKLKKQERSISALLEGEVTIYLWYKICAFFTIISS